MALSRFFAEDDAITALEYGLIASLVAVATVVALTSLGQSLESNYGDVRSALDTSV